MVGENSPQPSPDQKRACRESPGQPEARAVGSAPLSRGKAPLTLCRPMKKTEVHSIDCGVLARAQGCLLGQFAGDALGSLVEFRSEEEILREYPGGVRDLADGGTWNTIAGQPTDDSELALSLARVLVRLGRYDTREARKAYVSWLDSKPFDCGETIRSALRGRLNATSQANGAMMRISPLGIFGARHALSAVAEWARQDAALTHPNPVCRQANALFSMAIADAVRSARSAAEVHQGIAERARQGDVDASILEVVRTSASAPPAEYFCRKGWVLIGACAAENFSGTDSTETVDILQITGDIIPI